MGELNGNKPVIDEEDMYLRTSGVNIPILSAVLKKVDKGQGATNKAHYFKFVLKSPLLSDLSMMHEKEFSLPWHEIERRELKIDYLFCLAECQIQIPITCLSLFKIDFLKKL